MRRSPDQADFEEREPRTSPRDMDRKRNGDSNWVAIIVLFGAVFPGVLAWTVVTTELGLWGKVLSGMVGLSVFFAVVVLGATILKRLRKLGSAVPSYLFVIAAVVAGAVQGWLLTAVGATMDPIWVSIVMEIIRFLIFLGMIWLAVRWYSWSTKPITAK